MPKLVSAAPFSQNAQDIFDQEQAKFAKARAVRAADELARRRIEALKLYVPQPEQDEFHKCEAYECMFQGGNRVGKSLAAFVEDGRAVLGCDPYEKYPKRDGVLAIVGYKEWHIGNVIYPYLFKAGSFWIIRDEETQMWRTWRPWVPQDAARKPERKMAPPIIPPRMVEKIVWKDRAKQVFTNVYLKTGWEIKAFSSTAKPEQGYQADLFHIDEDIINPQWYEEAMGRLLDRKGKLRWSALPHDDNDAIARFAERAEVQEEEKAAGGDEPTTIVIRGSMENNPYLDQEAKSAAIKGWKSMGDDVYRKRALGELITDSVLMYPMWKRGIHDALQYTHLAEIKRYYDNHRVPPLDFCRRLSVDPGFGTGACLLVATPPSERFLLVYGEIYIHNCTAELMAKELEKATSKVWFQTFIIDSHGGNLTSMDTGIAPREAYEDEMAKRDVKCAETGSRFVPGCSVIAYREEILRGMLSVQGDGTPKIIVDFDACPNLDREMRRFRKKKVNGMVIDTGNRRANTHLIEGLEYAAAYVYDSHSPYVKPKGVRKGETAGQRRVRLYRQRMAEKQQKANPFGVSQTIILGPQGTMS